jgi:hypothetical protein
MDDKMSIVLATAVLAFSGIGLYMYKQLNEEDDDEDSNDDSDDEYSVKEDVETDRIFDFSNFFGSDKDNLDEAETETEDDTSSIGSDYEYYQPKKKQVKTKIISKTNTKRNRKSTGSTKRRY